MRTSPAAAVGLILSGLAAAGLAMAVSPPVAAGSLAYVPVMAAASTLRLTVLGLIGCVLAVPAVTRSSRPHWVGWSALALGAASAGVGTALTAPVFVAARSLGHSISLQDGLLGNGLAVSSVASVPKVVTFRGGDGWHLDADLYRPAAAGSSPTAPAIVVVHGGAWQYGDKGENTAWSRWLASRGYLVVDIQYRLAPKAGWRDAVGDIRSALDWVRAHAAELNVDVDRVVLLGRSAGGHLALLTAYADGLLEERHSPAAVVALYPPTDLARLYADAHGSSADEVRQGLMALLGDAPSAIPDVYAAASPLQLAQPGLPPTLLIHGARDELVPFEHSLLLGQALEQQGVDIEVLRVPSARHGFDLVSDSPAEQLARSVVLDFIEKRLPRRPARG